MDLAIDEVAAVCTRHLARGDRVGLYITAPGLKAVIPPDHGPAHGNKIAHALTVGCGTHDAHRSDLDDSDVAVRVLEHLRPLDSRGLADVRRGDLDKLASRADAMRSRAPFAATAPFGRSPRDRTLRRYLAAFGIDSPPKTDSDRNEAEAALYDALVHVARSKPRASLVHIVAPPPDQTHLTRLGEAVRMSMRLGATVSWSSPPLDQALEPPYDDPTRAAPDDEEPLLPPRDRRAATAMAELAAEAVRIRAHASQARREAGLKRLGIRVIRVKHAQPARASELSETEPAAAE
jgi:hypothetical protein